MKLLAFERRWAAEIGRAIIPADTFGGHARVDDLDQRFGRQADTMPWWSGILLRLAILVAWFAPPVLLRRLRTFGGLSPDERVAFLERLFALRSYLVREMVLVLKMNVCVVIMGRREVLSYLGAYDLGEPRAKAPPAIPAEGERSAS